MRLNDHEVRAWEILDGLLAKARREGDVEAMAVLLMVERCDGIGLGQGCTGGMNALLLTGTLLLQCLNLLANLPGESRAKAWDNFKGIMRALVDFENTRDASAAAQAVMADAGRLARMRAARAEGQQ